MNRMKGRLLKKLKSVKPIEYLKQDRVLQVKAFDGFVENFAKIPGSKAQTEENVCGIELDREIIDVNELMRDVEDQEIGFDDGLDDKENVLPMMKGEKKQAASVEDKENGGFDAGRRGLDSDMEDRKKIPLSEIDISSFRKPDFESSDLFDPNLLAAFKQAVELYLGIAEPERMARIENINLDYWEEQGGGESPSNAPKVENEELLSCFEEKCPPGGDGCVVFYTTSLRGIRKTFEDCSSVRFLLDSFKVVYFERDISMHMEYREELWEVLGGKELPPCLFIKGRYIGGAEVVLGLHEQGKLRTMLEGIAISQFDEPCEVCGGVRFILCYKCNGSHKVVSDNGLWTQCSVCNENGLTICAFCGS